MTLIAEDIQALKDLGFSNADAMKMVLAELEAEREREAERAAQRQAAERERAAQRAEAAERERAAQRAHEAAMADRASKQYLFLYFPHNRQRLRLVLNV